MLVYIKKVTYVNAIIFTLYQMYCVNLLLTILLAEIIDNVNQDIT